MSSNAESAPSDGKIEALFVSPIRGGLAAAILIAVGGALAFLPFYLLALDPSLGFSMVELTVGVFFLLLGGLILWPGFVIAKCIVMAHPMIRTDGTTVWKTRMGFSMDEITWQNVGAVGLRGLWVILLDGRLKQSRFTQIMFGAKGIWIPALLMHGGGAATMRFIESHKPELIEPLIARVVSGRR